MQLIQVGMTKLAAVGKNEKMEVLYSYLSGAEFRQRVETIVEAFGEMQKDLADERKAAERRWSKREKQLLRVIGSTSGMYGDLQGLIGSSLQTIPALADPVEEDTACEPILLPRAGFRDERPQPDEGMADEEEETFSGSEFNRSLAAQRRRATGSIRGTELDLGFEARRDRIVAALRRNPPTPVQERLIQVLLNRSSATPAELSTAMNWKQPNRWQLGFGTMCRKLEADLWPAPPAPNRGPKARFFTGLWNEDTKNVLDEAGGHRRFCRPRHSTERHAMRAVWG
jgi:hypothetical protein